MKLISLIVLALLLTSCGTKQVVVKKEIVAVEIPENLLTTPNLKKPRIKSLNDIKKAYIELKKGYDTLILQIYGIRELNERTKNAIQD